MEKNFYFTFFEKIFNVGLILFNLCFKMDMIKEIWYGRSADIEIELKGSKIEDVKRRNTLNYLK